MHYSKIETSKVPDLVPSSGVLITVHPEKRRKLSESFFVIVALNIVNDPNMQIEKI